VHYQAFFMMVVEGASASQVAEALGLRVAMVYLIKHRVAAQLKKEIQTIEKSTQQVD
jgi:DNA-directed RNA polymerase specialized sigma24 family protein